MFTWKIKAALHTARGFAAYTKLPDGKILASGGRTVYTEGIASCELYDPVADTWTVTGDLITAQGGLTTVLLGNGKVLAVSGQDAGTIIPTAELYDPATGIWSLTGSPNYPATASAVWILPSGKILMASGMAPGSIPNPYAEVYDPSTEIWTAVTSPPATHLDAAFASTGDGRALLIGDFLLSATMIDVYTEATDTWATYSLPGHPMPSNAEEGNQAIQLLDGNVLVAGGLLTVASELCYIFHQDSNTITQTGSLNTARVGASAAVQIDGSVVIVGGDDTISTIFSSTERYDPSTEIWSPFSSTHTAHARMTHDHFPVLADGSMFIAGGETGIGFGGITNTEILNEGTPGPSTAITVVQILTRGKSGLTTFPTALNTFTATAGNLLVLEIISANHEGITTVTDNNYNTWIQVPGVYSTHFQVSDLWYAANCNGGATVISVTASGDTGAELWVMEFAGADITAPLVPSSGTNIFGTGACVGPVLTPDLAGELLIECAFGVSYNLTDVVVPWTGIVGVTVTGGGAAYLIDAALSAQQSVWNPTSSQDYQGSGAVFKAALLGPSAKQKASMFLMID